MQSTGEERLHTKTWSSSPVRKLNLEVVFMSTDPVCKMMVDERKTKLMSMHEGKSFYFCSSACKTSFDKDPRKFVHK